MIPHRVQSIEALKRLLQAAKSNPPEALSPAPGFLLGWLNGKGVAEFCGDKFRIEDGLGRVYTGIFETEGLRVNEGYEEFLLSLEWTSAYGWTSPLHMLALEAE